MTTEQLTVRLCELQTAYDRADVGLDEMQPYLDALVREMTAIETVLYPLAEYDEATMVDDSDF